MTVASRSKKYSEIGDATHHPVEERANRSSSTPGCVLSPEIRLY